MSKSNKVSWFTARVLDKLDELGLIDEAITLPLPVNDTDIVEVDEDAVMQWLIDHNIPVGTSHK